MPDFMLTGPGGASYKLTTPDGVTHEDAQRELARSFSERAADTGSAPSENIEDRRGDQKDPYISMKIGTRGIPDFYRQTWPWLRKLDMRLPKPHHIPRESGALPNDIGIHDIGSGMARSDESHVRSDWNYPFTGTPTDAELAQTSTHQAEQPNPAQPYLDMATRFGTGAYNALMAGPRLMDDVMQGGLDPNSPEAIRRSFDAVAPTAGAPVFGAGRALGGAPAAMKSASDFNAYRQAAVQNPDNVAAMGMAAPGKGPFVSINKPNQFKTPGTPANANASSFSPSRTRASVEAELQDAHANIQGYKDAIARMPAGADSSHLYDDLAFEHQIAERLGKELSGQSEAGKVLGFHAAPAALERLPQPPLRQRVDRPINQQTLDEMRAAKPEPPPVDPRPINPETLAEMRANDPLGNGPLAPIDPLSK
jgi:hypothetical protein